MKLKKILMGALIVVLVLVFIMGADLLICTFTECPA